MRPPITMLALSFTIAACSVIHQPENEPVRLINKDATQTVRFDGFYRCSPEGNTDYLLRFYAEGYVAHSNAPKTVPDSRIARGWLDISGDFMGAIARSFTIRGDQITFTANTEGSRIKFSGTVYPNRIVFRLHGTTSSNSTQTYWFRRARFEDKAPTLTSEFEPLPTIPNWCLR